MVSGSGDAAQGSLRVRALAPPPHSSHRLVHAVEIQAQQSDVVRRQSEVQAREKVLGSLRGLDEVSCRCVAVVHGASPSIGPCATPQSDVGFIDRNCMRCASEPALLRSTAPLRRDARFARSLDASSRSVTEPWLHRFGRRLHDRAPRTACAVVRGRPAPSLMAPQPRAVARLAFAVRQVVSKAARRCAHPFCAFARRSRWPEHLR